jgi:hypothetical protein
VSREFRTGYAVVAAGIGLFQFLYGLLHADSMSCAFGAFSFSLAALVKPS